MTYQGPERRHRKVFVTKNTEYHLRDGVCVAVRDRSTGDWQLKHRAIGSTLMGGIAVTPEGSWKVSFGAAEVGEKLCFANDIFTTQVQDVKRPSVNTLDSYPVAALA